MDRQIESMFPASDPAVVAYKDLAEHFGGNAIVLLVYPDDQLFTADGLQRAAKLSDRVGAVPGVQATLSIAEVARSVEELRGISSFGMALLGEKKPPAILETSPTSIAFRKMFAGYTHNQAENYGAIVVMLQPLADPSSETQDKRSGRVQANHEATVASLRAIANDLPPELGKGVLVGQPVLVSEGYTMIQRDGQQLGTTTIWLLSVVLLILFRSPRWVLLALATIWGSSTVTRGLAVLLGLQLSLVSSMLTAILTVVSVAALIHIAVAWQKRRARGEDRQAATIRTLTRLLPPILWAGFTDAVGFAALMAADVGPVRDFGLLMTLGVGVVMLALFFLLPAGLCAGKPETANRTGAPQHTHQDNRSKRRRRFTAGFGRWGSRFTVGLLKHRQAILWGTCLLGLLTAIGLSRLSAETNFLRNFREESSIAKAYQLVEEQFGGAGVWDILLPIPDRPLTTADLKRVHNLEVDLQAIRIPDFPNARVTQTLSMADTDAAAALSENPLIRLAPSSVRLQRMAQIMPEFSAALMTPTDSNDDYHGLRMMLRSPENLNSEAKTALIQSVQQTVQQHLNRPEWQAVQQRPKQSGLEAEPGRVTGYYVLLARLVNSLLEDQWTSLGLAAIGIFVVVWWATGHFVWAALTLLANGFPVMISLAALGWLNIPLNMGGAMIAAVSIGLTIDGSLHFLASYRRSRQRYGRCAGRAVLRAQSQVSWPISCATVALVVGFAVLTRSDFVPTATFGALLSLAMLLGMLANQILLPVLLGRAIFSSKLLFPSEDEF